MSADDTTPEMIGKLYETMRRNLDIARARVGRPLTLADKILMGHLDAPEVQELTPGLYGDSKRSESP